MLQKEALVKFIEKSYLNKTIEGIVVESSNGTLTTHITTTGLIGNITMENYKIDEGEIGVYYPSTLLKMLSILDNDVEIDLETKKNSETGFTDVLNVNFKDKKGKLATYAAQDVDTILRPDKTVSPVNEYEVKIDLNLELINDILKSNSVIESNIIHFSYEKGKLFIIFGGNKLNTNKIKIEVTCEQIDDIGKIPFNASMLQSILSVNSKKFKEGTLEISVRGMIRLYFQDSDTTAEYFLLQEKEN